RLEAALATTIIPVSSELASLCGGTPRARIAPIPDGIPIPARPPQRSEFHDPLRLGVVGAIDRGKAQDLAVRSLPSLVASGLDVELHLIGREQDAAYAAEVRATARACGVEGRVRFHGELHDLEPVYAQLDMLLLPSRLEA